MDVGEALRRAIAGLEGESASPRAEAEELLGRLLGLRRSDLYLAARRALSAGEADTLERWLERRRASEPIQYITGRAAFRGLDLQVTPAVLVPRPETESLVERVLAVLREERTRWPAPRVLDLGTGSGAIALAIASELPEARVTATDASSAALEVARANAAALGLGRVRLRPGDWYRALPQGERFEAIVSNPPYVAESERRLLPADVRDHEPAAALFSGSSGLEALRAIVEGAPAHLAERGLLALEAAETRAAAVLEWLRESDRWSRSELREDLTGRPRVLLARLRKRRGSGSPARPPGSPP